jgi:hypothetical protein
MAVTTTELLASIKRAITMPASQIRFTNADLLAMADEETVRLIVPMITSIRQEFFVVKEDITLVADQDKYKIPYRAVGRTLREIKITDTARNTRYTIPFISPEDTQYVNYNPTSTGDVLGFTIRGDDIVILPTPSSSTNQIIEAYYELAPAQLVDPSECGVIASADYNTGIVTLVATPTTFTTGVVMDIVDGKAGCTTIGIDLTNTLVSGLNVTFTAADLPTAPNVIEAGDYLCLSNESPVVQLPNETVFVLVQAVAVKVLEAQGDYEGMRVAQEKLNINIEAAEKLLTPRVEASAPKIINRNGILRSVLNRPWSFRNRF